MTRKLSALQLIVPLLAVIACGTNESVAPAPVLRSPAFAWSIGEPVAYSGNLQPGVFVVCTSRLSPAGSYTYLIDASTRTEKFVKSVVMQPGECRVVAEAKDRGNKIDLHSVQVTAVSSFVSDGLVLIDGACDFNCDYPLPVSTATLEGDAGAVVKFYFRASVLGAGGHGGTGTLDFALD